MSYSGLGPDYLKDPVRKNKMYWWLGQVTDESHWIGNEELNLHNRDAAPGWGKRYRVRIFSRDSEVKLVPDSQLEMASTIAPVTSGSGHQGYGETVVLAQGSFVVGFYLDGEEGRQPIIFGTLPNNPQTRLLGGDPEDGFIPRSGFMGLTGNKKVATNDLYTSEDPHPCKEGCTVDGALDDVRRHDQKTDGDIVEPRKKNSECEGGGGPIKNIQVFISKTLSIIQFLKSQANSFLGAASDLKNNISNLVQEASSFVASMFKLIVGRMRGEVLKKINNGIKDAAQLLPPNLRQVFATTANSSVEGLSCVFQNLISTLFEMGKGFLSDIIDGFIVAPMCAAEKLVGDMIGNILGTVTGAIEGALNAIDGVLSAVGDIAGGIFDVFDIITTILTFFQCPTSPNCKIADEWSFWNGDKEAAAVSESLNNLLKDVAEGGDVVGCNTRHSANTFPSISFVNDLVDGAKSTLSASPIVSAAGAIMGVSITDPGSNLTSTPSVVVSPNNNTGGGANIKLITSDGSTTSVDPKQGDSIEVVGAVVLDPGQGYLQSPDGSSNFPSGPNDIIVITSTGDSAVVPPGTLVGGPESEFDISIPSSQEVEADNAVLVFIPPGLPPIPIYDVDTGVQTNILTSEGIEVGIPIPPNSTFTTPTQTNETTLNTSSRPTLDGREVDVIIESFYIDNPGVNYSKSDQIIIEPSNGVELLPVFNDIGQLVDLNIVNPGDTFFEVPKIFIKSESGVNANIIPIFGVRRDEEPDQRLIESTGDRVISIIDNVGNIPKPLLE